MAMPASCIPIRRYKSMGWNSDEQFAGLEAASQTFLIGEPLYYVSGFLTRATDDPSGGSPVQLAGVADENGHNATAGAKTVAFSPAFQNVLFVVTLTSSSGASYTLLGSEAGNKYALKRCATNTNQWALDQSDTTGVTMLVWSLYDPIGTVNGRVVASFVSNGVLGTNQVNTTVY